MEAIQKKQEVTVERVKNAVNEILKGKEVCKNALCNKRKMLLEEGEPSSKVKKSKFAHFEHDEEEDSDNDSDVSVSESVTSE